MKHVVTITTSNPSHEHVSLRRRQSTTNFMVEAADEEQAILRASAHFRKLGHYIHEAKIFKKKDEQLDESAALRPVVTAARIALPSLVAAAKTPLAKIADVVDDAVDAAKKAVTRSKQVGTHNKETNIGSVVTHPKPAPVTVPVPAQRPMPAPSKTAPTELPTPVQLPGKIAGKLPEKLPKKPEPSSVTKPDSIPKHKPEVKTQPKSGGRPPRGGRGGSFGDPRVGAVITPPSLDITLGNRGEIDIGTLGQYRGMFPLYRFADPYSRNNMMQEKVSLNAIGRVMSKRKKDNKEDAEGEKNKINMEPKLKTGGKQ